MHFSFGKLGAVANGAPKDVNPVEQLKALAEQLIAFLRRQWPVFAIVTASSLLIALIYLLVTPAGYTASVTLLIDSSKLRVLQDQLQPPGNTPLDVIQIGSQVEILASEKIALAVVRRLKLADDPAFVANDGTADREKRAVDELLSHRSISRVERTYALAISFTARDPVVAAKIANAIADAYIDDQLDAKYETTRRASSWLQGRIQELKDLAVAADQMVLDFKERNSIIDLGGGSPAAGGQGRLIGEQQLFDMNTQLATARGVTSEAKARLERIEQVRRMDVSEAAVSDLLKNDVVTRLRNQYLDLSAREANLTSRYGADHAAAVNLRNQMQELRRNISDELGRIAGSYQSDYEIAKTREKNLERDLAKLVSEGQSTNRDRLGLNQLESSAKAYHTIHDAFLQRYTEAIQQQSFPITEARVIDVATPPTKKSKPNAPVIVTIATALGLVLSLGIATVREAIDGVFRTARQAEEALGLRCLAVVPLLASLPAQPIAGKRQVDWRPHDGTARPGRPPELSAGAVATSEPARAQGFTITVPSMRAVADNPWSLFAEAFRAIKLTAELRSASETANEYGKVVGITSTLPDEGKSTVACNLAMLMADAGKRVVLVDTDFRNPTLSKVLAPSPAAGLMQVLNGKMDLKDVIGQEQSTGLMLLPLLASDHPVHADEILSSKPLAELVAQLRQTYQYVILDLPPIAPLSDVRAAVPLIDWLVFVVAWGSTSINAARHHLLSEGEILERTLGIVLNKADLKAMRRFEPAGLYPGGYYQSDLYGRPASHGS
jgi:succinoglycan biosynthesis transport protein ExoP